MVQDVDAFCLHPWGRESFLKTITCMKPPKSIPLKCEDPIATLVDLLKQETFRPKGFPLALQLLAFQAVSELQSIIPAPLYSLSIMQLEEPHLHVYPKISYLDMLRVEAVENLAVTSLIPIQSQPQSGWETSFQKCFETEEALKLPTIVLKPEKDQQLTASVLPSTLSLVVPTNANSHIEDVRLTLQSSQQRKYLTRRPLWRKIVLHAPTLLSANMQLSFTANLPASQPRSTQHISLQSPNTPLPNTLHPYTPLLYTTHLTRTPPH
ncbi:unnamed protein product [Brassica oleracea]